MTASLMLQSDKNKLEADMHEGLIITENLEDDTIPQDELKADGPEYNRIMSIDL